MANVAQLRKIMPHLSLAEALIWALKLNAARARFGIDTPLREAAFLAQLAHESGELRFTEEIWGPSDIQKGYEGRRDLGNVLKGDGYRFRGRGPIQITGRANYAAAGKAIGYDLVHYPDLAKQKGVGALIAAWYWTSRNINEAADRRDFHRVTQLVNGTRELGYAQREAYYRRALSVLGGE